MTTDDLRTLVRDDVTWTEPTTGLDAMVPIRLGRRRLRARRLAAGATAAVVVAVGAIAVPQFSPHRDRVEHQPPVANAQDLAALVEPVLGPHLPSLGVEVQHDTAHGVEVFWGELGRSVTVTVDDTPGLPDRGVTDDVAAQRLVGNVGPVGSYQSYAWADVAPGKLRLLNPGERFFVRRAQAVRNGVQVIVAERVLADDLQTAEGLFVVPVAELRQIATDPEVASAH
jgi:hypothetical protein